MQTLVRTYSAGVHFGEVKVHEGSEVTLTNARRVWSWQGANSLNEIALHGVADGSRISEQVPEITLTGAIELIPMSNEASERFASQGWGKKL